VSDLLDKALHKPRKPGPPRSASLPPPDPDTAAAWLRREIGIGQITHAIGGKTNTTAYVWLVMSLREAFVRGMLTISSKGESH
jgi:hypothetical protein